MKRILFLFPNIFIISIILFFSLLNTGLAYDFVNDSGLNVTGNKAGFLSNKTNELEGKDPTIIAARIIKIITIGVGIGFLLFMIYGGYTWMLARGNDQEVEKAKNIILHALIGLALVLAAYIIANFVGARLADKIESGPRPF